MDILIEDSIQGKGRKILIADARGGFVKEIEDSDQISDKTQTMEYINACRAVFKIRQAMKQQDSTTRSFTSEQQDSTTGSFTSKQQNKSTRNSTSGKVNTVTAVEPPGALCFRAAPFQKASIQEGGSGDAGGR